MESTQVFQIVCVVLSIILYGTTFVPIKKLSGGDGIFVQWMLCIGQLIPGMFVLWFNGFPPIYPMAMLGGVFYAVGNSFAVYIMEGIGMIVGGLLWNSTCCVMGWAVARYGLFGTPIENPNSPMINIFGVIVILIGGGLFTFVRNTPIKIRPHPHLKEKSTAQSVTASSKNRTICIVLALCAGCFLGNIMTPINIMMKHSEDWNVPSTVEPYLFSHFFGGFVTSTAIFIVYSIIKSNTPVMNPEITLPSIVSGVIYGTAVVLFFIANQNISQVIVFPVVAICPGIVNSLWGILLFKEIQGRRNLSILAIAYCLTALGVVLIAVSKV